MQEDTIRVGVMIERRRSDSPWAAFSWHVLGAVTEPPAESWTEVRKGDRGSDYLACADLTAHRSDTSGYRENLTSGAPRLWIVLRPTDDEHGCELALITADPAEGEAMTQNGDLLVETAAMPPSVCLWLSAFVQQHHVERPFIKRRRE